MLEPDIDDDTVLEELRSECDRWGTRDDVEAGFGRLFALRDEALKRGLPIPMSCPLGDPDA